MHLAHPPLPDLAPLIELLGPARRIAVLTGAGLSTESGIPDYRSPRPEPRARPIRYMEFVRKPDMRRRYWARSMVGWPAMSQARPNAGHRAIAALEQAGRTLPLITQNVDRLHQAAGSEAVIELHGALAEVRCLDCGAITDRSAMQARLLAANPGWRQVAATINPDGDATMQRTDYERFVVPPCATCGGMLKPRVVFFGESVPPQRVEASHAAVAAADALLVAGSSLTVWSGYRFVKAAAERGQPIAAINMGSTRADDLFDVKIAARTGEVLPALVDGLGVGVG